MRRLPGILLLAAGGGAVRRRIGVAAIAALLVTSAGVAGAQTAPEPAAPTPSVSDATVRVARLDLASGQAAFAIATCPAGTRATGGGVGTAGPDPAPGPSPTSPFTVHLSGPLGPSGSTATTEDGDVPREWFGAVGNTSGAPQDFRIFALCSRVSDATIRVARINGLTQLSSAAAVATCPANMRVVGGGVNTMGPPTGAGGAYSLLLSGPLDETGTTAGTEDGDVARSWYAAIRNESGDTQDFKVFAVCSRTSDAVVRVAGVSGVPSLGSGAASAVCPAGRRVVGGGVNTPTGAAPSGLEPMYFAQVNGPQDETGATAATTDGDVARRWHASIQNFTGSPQDFKVFALCESEPAGAGGGATGGGGSGSGSGGSTRRTAADGSTGPQIRLSVDPRRATRGKRTAFTFTARVGDRRLARALIRFAGTRAFTSRRGRATVRVRVTRQRTATASKAGYRTGSATIRLKRRAARASMARAKGRCVRAQIGGRRVCLRVGRRCTTGLRSAYLAVKLDCVLRRGRRVLAKATPAALREGRYIALGPSGQPTLGQALAAFDRTIADLPGVSPPPGTVGPTTSGTTALRWVTDYLDELTPAQRAVFAEAIAPGPDAQTVDIDADGNVLDDPAAPPPAGMASKRARAHAAQVDAFKQIVREAAPRLAARGLVVRHSVTVSFASQGAGDPWADAYPMWLCAGTAGNCAQTDTLPNACRIRIYPSAQNASLVLRRQIVLHELTHCAQFESMGSMREVGATPQWIMDGTADFAAQTLGRQWSGALGDASWWPVWLRQSARGLYARGYDAVGFWTLLSHDVDVFARIGPVVRAGSAGDSQAAFSVATQGLGANYVLNWGSTLAMSDPLGPLWTFPEPGVPRERIGVRAVTNLTGITEVFDARAGAVAAVEISADIVHITVSPLTRGRLRDARDAEHTLAGRQDFCTRDEGCSCPDGSETPASRYPKLPAGATYIGVANVDSSATWSIAGESLDAACKRRSTGKEKPAGPAPGRSGPGLELRDLNTSLMGRITSGTCSVRGGTFVATGRGSGYRFQMRIPGATRPGSYVIPIGSASTFVQVSGPGGTYTSNRGVQGFPGGGSADISRVRVRRGKRTVTRWRLSVGVTPLFSGGQPAAAIIPAAGGLIC